MQAVCFQVLKMNFTNRFAGLQSISFDYESLNSVYVRIYRIIPICFTLIGLAGNLISYVIYSRPCFQVSSAAFYLRSMAVIDSLALVIWTEMFYLNFGIDLKTSSSIACKVLAFFTYSVPAMSAWLVFALSVDRMINIWFKEMFYFMRLRGFQVLIGIVLVIFILAIYSPILIFYDLVHDTSPPSCSSSNLIVHLVTWMNTGVSALAPFPGMLVSSILVLYRFHDNSLLTSSHAQNLRTVTKKDILIKRRALKEKQLAMTSVIKSLVFIVTTISVTIMSLVVIYNFNVVNMFIFKIVVIVYKANFMLPFLVYWISNRRFRTELRDMILGFLLMTSIERLKNQSRTTSSRATQN